MTEADELLPCPFCGAEPVEKRIQPHKHYLAQMPDYPGAWSVECAKCEVRVFDHNNRANAVAKWNRRAPADAEYKHQEYGVTLGGKKAEWRPAADGVVAPNWRDTLMPADANVRGVVTGPLHVVCKCDACAAADGMVVPMEPTEAMIVAGSMKVTTDIENGPACLYDVYKAMLSAAPSDRKGGGE